MLQIYTGNGKGKTTASLGLAIRAVGAGKRVGIIYFDKGGETHYSERAVLRERFAGEITIVPTGLDRIDPVTNEFRFGVTEADRQEAHRGLQMAREWIASQQFDLIILDEINSTVALGMLTIEEVLAVVRARPSELELVLTGRDAPEAFTELADLFTEMTLVKHYFYDSVPARAGFDY
ncbi:MAG: cob(I)yrinic acid a,c-diamide adenosyltransferase [Candidatus Magasanikbacteria bacterium]|nr:cob(I)yrinic acid a,c-diamide adenosyltransferase [Candidatus Magasanikbacteria bacterium]